METKIWDLRDYADNIAAFPEIETLKQTIVQGGNVAIPTETVYGLGANACDARAVTKVYEAKGRPSDNPLIVHIHHRRQLDAFVAHIPENVTQLMEAFWPGPISFILPYKSGYLADRVTGGLNSVAVRMPSHPIGHAILAYLDLPIAAPSANLSGRPSPTTFEHVYQDLNGRIEGIVNGDQSEEGLESTVLDCTQYPFRIARPGSITAEMIRDVCPDSIDGADTLDHERPIAPGMKYKHYAPDTTLTILKGLQHKISDDGKWRNTAFIMPQSLQTLIPNQAHFMPLCTTVHDVKGAAHRLYDILHELDHRPEIKEAYIYGFEINDASEAIMNRMEKAAHHTYMSEEDL